jgi:predicted metal-dependent HD superfamily phosphohydrolase
MLQRWNKLWSALGGDTSGSEVYEFLRTHYEGKDRHYHAFPHIARCLDLTEEIRGNLRYPDAFEFAFWFHDVIYDTRGKGNEERSADAAKDILALTEQGGLASEVTSYILATKHNVVPVLQDEQYFVDIDLAILGVPVSEFDEYERQIRREYAWVEEAYFMSERAKILQSFLERPRIYQTSYFNALFEVQARNNLARSIAQLSRA